MILEFDGIQFGYAGRTLLSSVYMKCETGKISGLLGRNGEGKSTLLKIVFGSIACDDASIRIDGTYLEPPAFRSRRIGYLPQDGFIPLQYTLRKILDIYHANPKDIIEAFPELANELDNATGNLSGGYIRLFEVLLILNSGYQFCLLDEPFTGLAPVMIERLSDYMRKTKADKAILMTDHLHRQIVNVSDSLYVLANGKTYPVQGTRDLIERGYLSASQ